MNFFYLYKDELLVGPLTNADLQRMCTTGEATANMSCRQGHDGPWKRVSDFMPASAFAGAASAKAPRASTNAANGVPDAQFVRSNGPQEAVIACPSCSQRYAVNPAQYAGQDVACTSCQTIFHVPGDIAAPAQEETADAARHAPRISVRLRGSTPAEVPAAPPPPRPATAMAASRNDAADSGWEDLAQEIPDGDLLCPHCWQSFDSDNLLSIAVHPSLTGDPVLGDFVQQRFRPSTFNNLGQPLDACGLPTTDTACPRCHLEYPLGMIDNPSLYFSIAGATSSGKSYFLTCLIHQLRKLLPQYFNIGFYDLSPTMNETLVNYEKQLFMSLEPDKVTALPATQLSGDGISDRVLLDRVEIELPKPFIFGCRPPAEETRETNLVFYDNSGEMFIPGRDEWVNQATFHLSHSSGIVFLFDPTNDANMRRSICNEADPQVSKRPRAVDQMILFNEMISRIRRHANLGGSERCSIPLVVALGKYDTWRDHFDFDLAAMRPVVTQDETLEGQLDMDMIASVSFAAREMMHKHLPELVDTAERFFQEVTFIPVSSFGTMAEMAPEGFVGVVPSKISPIWLEIPAMVLMAANSLLPVAVHKDDGMAQHGFAAKWQNGQIIFRHPQSGAVVRLPGNYAGRRITIGDKLYDLPRRPAGEQRRNERNPWK